MKRSFLLAGCIALLMAGCRSVPFEATPRQPLPPGDPRQAAGEFAASLPERFELAQSVTFRYWGRAVAALGYAKIDSRQRTFELLCLNHLGVQLFHVAGDATTTDLRFALPEFTERGDFGSTVGTDLRRIFFDWAPPADATVRVVGERILFRSPTEAGVLEYVFAGNPLRLQEKRFFPPGHRRRLAWTVSYYEYGTTLGKVLPRGAVLDNAQYGYRLILRTRDVMLDPSE